jgi:hypothetical protein
MSGSAETLRVGPRSVRHDVFSRDIAHDHDLCQTVPPDGGYTATRRPQDARTSRLRSSVDRVMLAFRPMRRVGLLLVLPALLAASGCFGDGASSSHVTASEEGSAPTAQVRGCRQRIEGGGANFTPNRWRDAVAGPVSFFGARSAYRATLPTAESHIRVLRLKVPVVVRSGAPVTLAVPASERRWLHLVYLQSNRPTRAVTLNPCPHVAMAKAQRRACHWSPYAACRTGLTWYGGGFFLNFRRSPLEGRCAILQVWAGERPNPITIRPFTRRGCHERPPGGGT